MMAIDITNLENVKKGDEVVLIGNQGELEITVSDFGQISQQVNYELLTPTALSYPPADRRLSRTMAFIRLYRKKLKHNYEFLDKLFRDLDADVGCCNQVALRQ